jgi:hypothetical protein
MGATIGRNLLDKLWEFTRSASLTALTRKGRAYFKTCCFDLISSNFFKHNVDSQIDKPAVAAPMIVYPMRKLSDTPCRAYAASKPNSNCTYT